MTQPGSVVEVLSQSRGSQLVGDHASGATTLLVDDPTPFDDNGGQVYLDGTAYTYTGVAEISDPADSSTTNGQLALTSGLVATELDMTPVEVWNGSQILNDLVLMVATGEEGDPPVPVLLTVTQRTFWEGREGPVEPPVAVLLSDDLEQLLDAPGYSPSIGGAISTAGSGPHMEITPDRPSQIRFYSGLAEEVAPGHIELDAGFLGVDYAELEILLPDLGTGGMPSIHVKLDANGDSSIQLATAGGQSIGLFDPALGDGFKLNNVGAGIHGVDFGAWSGTTNASGLIVISHNLGFTPVHPDARRVSGPGSRVIDKVTAKSSTTFTISIVNSTTGAAAPAGEVHSGSYLAIG